MIRRDKRNLGEGHLYIVPTPIGNLGDITLRAIEVLRISDILVCEDTREAKKLLSHLGIPSGNRLMVLHDHNEDTRMIKIAEEVENGKTVALMSDAGMPGIADPGIKVVAFLLENDLSVEVLPGPSAALTALVASGLPSYRFVFEGFIPRKGSKRFERLDEISKEHRTIIIYESPHRIKDTMNDLYGVCEPDRQVAIVRELTKMHEEVWRGTLEEAYSIMAVLEPRGEYVIILGTSEIQEPEIDYIAIERDVLILHDDKMSTRDIAELISQQHSISKKEAYSRVLNILDQHHNVD
jgi:16S rRNA (cytidine1402-2'-O)-methyltransferase